VAVFEAAKGMLVLLVGVGLLSLIHRDVEAIAERLVRMGHLNPASHYPEVFIDAASHVTDGRLWAMAGAAALYSLVRVVEAYGLWHERRWAEWFALVAGGLYLPIELFEVFHRWSWLKLGILITNLAIVAYMAYALLHGEQQDREMKVAQRGQKNRAS
jgi:uncharacterized membrane protein (DUF2068 family)